MGVYEATGGRGETIVEDRESHGSFQVSPLESLPDIQYARFAAVAVDPCGS